MLNPVMFMTRPAFALLDNHGRADRGVCRVVAEDEDELDRCLRLIVWVHSAVEWL